MIKACLRLVAIAAQLRCGQRKKKKRNGLMPVPLWCCFSPNGACKGGGMVLVLLIFNGLHDFCFQLFAQFGVVFEQVLGGVAALT